MTQKKISSMVLRDMNSDSNMDVHMGSSTSETHKGFWGSMKTYCYNSKDGTCCHRTSSQWVTMLLYYMVYTTFIVMLYLAFQFGCVSIIKHLYPDHSILDKENLLESAQPGLGFVPNIVVTKFPIIWYSSDPSEGKTEDDYIKALDKFFQKYKNAKKEIYTDCSSSDDTRTKPCYFDLEGLKECSSDRYFYTNSSLCFFLKLNRRKHWKPVVFKNDRDLPDEMSSSMIDHVLASSDKDVVYVECNGQNLWDNEHMGEINYYPKQGFDGYYFPYDGGSEYLSPLVAVKLSNVTTGIVIHIKCTVWAQNIETKVNHLHLKVFIDNTLPY